MAWLPVVFAQSSPSVLQMDFAGVGELEQNHNCYCFTTDEEQQ